MRKPSQWKHKKYKNKIFTGHYERTSKSNDRVFTLVFDNKKLTFESYIAAIKKGWVKIT